MRYDAEFSPCKQYRYYLSREWGTLDSYVILWIMLNPSVGDATRNDSTITRLVKRAMHLNLGGLVVANLFAYVSTNPRKLLEVEDPVGPENDTGILSMLQLSPRILYVALGWGDLTNNDLARQRAARMVSNVYAAGRTPVCLGTTKYGYPRHPLHVAYSVGIRPYP